jgi:hypothetical protein
MKTGINFHWQWKTIFIKFSNGYMPACSVDRSPCRVRILTHRAPSLPQPPQQPKLRRTAGPPREEHAPASPRSGPTLLRLHSPGRQPPAGIRAGPYCFAPEVRSPCSADGFLVLFPQNLEFCFLCREPANPRARFIPFQPRFARFFVHARPNRVRRRKPTRERLMDSVFDQILLIYC